jgi:hypothetical protein
VERAARGEEEVGRAVRFFSTRTEDALLAAIKEILILSLITYGDSIEKCGVLRTKN